MNRTQAATVTRARALTDSTASVIILGQTFADVMASMHADYPISNWILPQKGEIVTRLLVPGMKRYARSAVSYS